MSRKPIGEDLAAVEAALASLTPVPCGVDRDRMMFQAGRASAPERLARTPRRRADWLWACATAASVLTAVTFATLWLSRSGMEVAERKAGVEAERAAEIEPRPEKRPVPIEEHGEVAPEPKKWRSDYLQLRRLVMTQGVDALPPSGSRHESDAETLRFRSGHRDTLEQLLEG